MLTAVTTHQVVSYACNWSRFLPGFQVVLKSSLVLLYCKGEKYVFDGPLVFVPKSYIPQLSSLILKDRELEMITKYG